MAATIKVDVTEEAHSAAKRHCRARNLRVKDWVSELITRAANPPEPVEKKPAAILPPERETDVWRRPPFWATG